MSEVCGNGCGKVGAAALDKQARRILWAVLIANAAMFLIEAVGGYAAGSLALQADALDFGADAATYGVTLWAVGRSVATRTKAATLKSFAMLLMGIVVLALAVAKFLSPTAPEAAPMGSIAVLALSVNLGAVLLLMRFRRSDANLRSVWLCSRNDALGNVLVIAAAAVTAATRSPWPDLAVGVMMSLLFLSASWSVYEQTRAESLAARLGSHA